jgi:hypothetical protein
MSVLYDVNLEQLYLKDMLAFCLFKIIMSGLLCLIYIYYILLLLYNSRQLN